MIDPLVRLKKMVQSGHLPHLLLFYGPQSQPLFEAALNFAALVLDKKELNSSDVHEVKVVGKLGMHTVAALRQLLQTTAMRADKGRPHFFVIHEAERMLPASANLLLKTLEEPISHAIFILLSTKREQLLATILSRAQKIAFGGTAPFKLDSEQEQVALWLKQGVSLDEIEAFAATQLAKRRAREELLAAQINSEWGVHEKENAKRQIEGDLSLMETTDFLNYLKVVALWYRDLNVMSLGVPCREGKFYFKSEEFESRVGTALPYKEVEGYLQAAKLGFSRTVSLQQCLEVLFMKLGLIR